MTPIEQMVDAASRHPVVVARLASLSRKDRELHISFLKTQVRKLGRGRDLIDLDLIQGHLEVQSLSKLFR